MEFKRCYGCMRELSAPGTVCPCCGYDNIKGPKEQPVHALYCGAVLAARYVIGRIIDMGGLDLTYIAWDLTLDEAVCIKEYFSHRIAKRDSSQSTAVYWYQSENAQQGQEDFLKEAQKAVRLRDLHSVAAVWNVFQENDTAYIVMDYVEGTTLKSYLRQKGKTLSEIECVELFSPVMKDLAEVHKRGIIHRDINPENLMLCKNGTLKLVGFEEIKDLRDEDDTALCLPRFNPIEQCSQHGEIGAWTDVYAMCATIFYCTKGKLILDPFERLMGKSMDLDGLSPAFASVLKNGLAVEPEERTQNMGELLAEIRAAVGLPSLQKQVDEENKTQEFPLENQDSIELWVQSVQNRIGTERVHVGEQATYFPSQNQVLIKRWGLAGTQQEAIIVPASIHTRSEVIRFLAKKVRLPSHIYKEIDREEAHGGFSGTTCGIFVGGIQLGEYPGYTFFRGEEKICEITGKKLPLSWISIQGLGYTWYSMIDPDITIISGNTKRIVIDSRTNETAFQILFISRDKYQIQLEGRRIDARVSAKEIMFFSEGKTIAVCKMIDDPRLVKQFWLRDKTQAVRIALPTSPAQALAILSFSSLLFGFHDYAGAWSAASLLKDSYSNYTINAEFSVSKMSNEDCLSFASFMKDMQWEDDNDLYWLAMLEPPRYSLFAQQTVQACNLASKIQAILKLLGQVYYDLEATISIRYSGSLVNWKAGLHDTGGFMVITLKNGKLECDDTPYS